MKARAAQIRTFVAEDYDYPVAPRLLAWLNERHHAGMDRWRYRTGGAGHHSTCAMSRAFGPEMAKELLLEYTCFPFGNDRQVWFQARPIIQAQRDGRLDEYLAQHEHDYWMDVESRQYMPDLPAPKPYKIVLAPQFLDCVEHLWGPNARALVAEKSELSTDTEAAR